MAQPIMSSVRRNTALRAPEGGQQDNPFAPPPEGAPDQPWQPRRPEGSSDPDRPEDGRPTAPSQPPAWGSSWSSQQPHRQDGWGDRKGGPSGAPPGGGLRFDPTDPAQRRARYALLSGMWGLFFSLLGWTYVSLLLGALGVYWGISALRMKPEERRAAQQAAASALKAAASSGDPDRPAPEPARPGQLRPQTTAAWSGIVASALTLAVVAASFSLQIAYQDYFTCKRDALTAPAADACQKHLPTWLRDIPAFE